MKNKIIALIVMCLMFANCIPAFANTDVNSNTIVGTENIDEIKYKEEEFIESFNQTISSESMDKIDKLNYDKAVRLYQADILQYDELTNEIMQESIKDAISFYYIPIFSNGKTGALNIQQRLPLTDDVRENLTQEEIEKYEASIGEWHNPVIDFYDYTFDYKGEIEKALEENHIENANVYIVCAISQSITTVAVICTDNPDDTKIKILEQFDQTEDGLSGSPLDKNVLHTLDEIKEVVSQETPVADDEDAAAVSNDIQLLDTDLNVSDEDNEKGNTLLIISIVSGVAVVAIAVAVICVIRKKKAKNIES